MGRFKIANFIAQLSQYVDRPWYLGLMALLAALDLFVGIVPSDALVISAVILKPKAWARVFTVVAMGSALGAVMLSFAIQAYGESLIHRLIPGILNSAEWNHLIQLIAQYGGFALALISISPMPQQPAVIVCALARMPIETIFLAVWIGRSAKYGFFAWTSTHMPGLLFKVLRRSKRIREQTTEIQKAEATTLKSKKRL